MRTSIRRRGGTTWQAALLFLCVVVTGITLVPAGALAGNSGFFIGYGMAQVKIGGDMDGVSFVGGGGSLEVMPDQPTETGNKYLLGWQSGFGSFDFSYVKSDHDGVWGGVPYPSTYTSFIMDGKAFLRRGTVQPFLLLGVGFTSVKVRDGSTDGFIFRNATFKGLDVRLGAGLELSVMQNLALGAQIVQRFGSYNSVDGIVSGSISDDVDGNGTTASLELKLFL